MGQDKGVPVDSWAGRRNYPGKWEQKMLLGASGSSSCFLLASLSPGISSSKKEAPPVSHDPRFLGAPGLARMGSLTTRALISYSQPCSLLGFPLVLGFCLGQTPKSSSPTSHPGVPSTSQESGRALAQHPSGIYGPALCVFSWIHGISPSPQSIFIIMWGFISFTIFLFFLSAECDPA